MTPTFTYADHADLPRIVAIYNQTIASRLVTADLEPVTVSSREAWFAAFDPHKRPIWKMMLNSQIAGWVSLENFYGRPAYQRTAELSIYISQEFRHHAWASKHWPSLQLSFDSWESKTSSALFFTITTPAWDYLRKTTLRFGVTYQTSPFSMVSTGIWIFWGGTISICKTNSKKRGIQDKCQLDKLILVLNPTLLF